MIEPVSHRLRRAYRELREPREQLSERHIKALQRPRSTQVVGVSSKGAPRVLAPDARTQRR